MATRLFRCSSCKTGAARGCQGQHKGEMSELLLSASYSYFIIAFGMQRVALAVVTLPSLQ